jgi:hypothetical protein
MDPFIEGQRWRDFHHNFLAEIQRTLMPQLRPRYEALVAERVYLEHHPEPPPPWIEPDVTVVQEPAGRGARGGGGVAVLTPMVPVPIVMPERVREDYLELRVRETGDVVTVIEVLSPTNKRGGSDGRQEYLQKREEVILSTAHLVEFDLLRSGQRLPMARPLPEADYYAIVSRARRRPICDVAHFTLRHTLPTIGIPLAGEDPDVTLDLGAVFTRVYEAVGYDYRLRYDLPVAPPLEPEDEAWVQAILRERGAGRSG